MEGFEGLTEEQLQQLIELGVIDEQQGFLGEQAAQANAIRNQAGPQMQGNGRVMTAANPLEFLGQGIQKFQAGKDLEEIGKKRQGNIDKRLTGRQALLDAIRNRAGQLPQGVLQPDIDMNMGGYA